MFILTKVFFLMSYPADVCRKEGPTGSGGTESAHQAHAGSREARQEKAGRRRCSQENKKDGGNNRRASEKFVKPETGT